MHTPLFWAAGNGYEGIVTLLLARKDVKAGARDMKKRTPLSFAAEKGYREVVLRLLSREDVNANAQDMHGRSPHWYAVTGGHTEVASLIEAHLSTMTSDKMC